MNFKQNLTVLFWLYRQKAKADGKAPIYARITSCYPGDGQEYLPGKTRSRTAQLISKYQNHPYCLIRRLDTHDARP